MKHKIKCQGLVIAEFVSRRDAEHFLEWKREKMLLERNSEILDQIASENGLDRRFPGLFPINISSAYYDRASAKIAEECHIVTT